MKTKNIFPIISLALLLTCVTAMLAAPIVKENPSISKLSQITYVVNINPGDHLSGFNCTYYIVVKDERGNQVAPIQLFRMGVWSYIVKEKGPVTGTRTAELVRNPQMICPGSFFFPPQSQTGTFKGGETYTFTLAPADTNGEPTSGD